MLITFTCLLLHFAAFFVRYDKDEQLTFATYLSLCRCKIQLNNLIIPFGMLLCDNPKPHSAVDVVKLLVSFGVIFYGGCVYVVNAVSDLEDDIREKPHRPLPEGIFRVDHAKCFAIFNFGLGMVSGAALNGMRALRFYSAFMALNLVYSFFLRGWRSPIVPCAVVTLTAPLRLCMGATFANGSLPMACYILTYMVYLAMQLQRKLVMQKDDAKQPASAKVLPVLVVYVATSIIG